MLQRQNNFAADGICYYKQFAYFPNYIFVIVFHKIRFLNVTTVTRLVTVILFIVQSQVVLCRATYVELCICNRVFTVVI